MSFSITKKMMFLVLLLSILSVTSYSYVVYSSASSEWSKWFFCPNKVIQKNEVVLEKQSDTYMEVRHIVLKGTNEEIGKALADIAQKDYDVKLMKLPSESLTKKREYIQQNYAILFERMKGVALSYALSDNRFFDTSTLYYDADVLTGCSAIAYPKAVTTNRHTLVARNLDFYTVGLSEFIGLPKNVGEYGLYSRVYVLELYPDKGYSSMIFGGFDLLNGMHDGINSKGITVSGLVDGNMKNITSDPKKVTGITCQQLMMQILDEAGTLEEAKETIVSNTDVSMLLDGMHLLVVDSSGKSFIAEMSNDKKWHFTEGDGKKPQLITNHAVYLYPDTTTFPIVNKTEHYNSFNRYSTLENYISGHKGKYSSTDAAYSMSLVYGNIQKIRAEGAAKPLPLKTLWSIILDLNHKSVQIKYYLKDGPINPDTNSPTLEFSKIYTFKLNPFMR